MNYGTTTALVMLPFLVQTRVRPTGITVSSAGHFQVLNSSASPIAASSIAFNQSSRVAVMVGVGVASGLVAGNAVIMGGSNTSALIYATGCEL
jgi:hypothetical protein